MLWCHIWSSSSVWESNIASGDLIPKKISLGIKFLTLRIWLIFTGSLGAEIEH